MYPRCRLSSTVLAIFTFTLNVFAILSHLAELDILSQLKFACAILAIPLVQVIRLEIDMEARYSKLLHTPPNPKSAPSSYSETVWKDKPTTEIPMRPPVFIVWISAVWSLVLFCVLSVGITLFLLVYVKNRAFNGIDRRPSVQLIGRTVTLQLAPIQSDIVTILSSMLVVQKWALAACVAPLCWRVGVFLIENYALPRRDLKVLIKYRLLAPRTCLMNFPTFAIGALLLACLAASLASPILTGSIAWVPKNQLVDRVKTESVQLEEVGAETSAEFNTVNPDVCSSSAIGAINIGWRRETDKHVYKRVTSLFEDLAINSTIERATLPVFITDSIKWIENEHELPTYLNKSDINSSIWKATSVMPAFPKAVTLGYVLMITDTANATSWEDDPLVSRTVEERRLLVYWFGANNLNLTNDLPPSAYIQANGAYYYAFAWVTFRAGVGICEKHECIISSGSTFQNKAPIKLEPHPLTVRALSLVGGISNSLVTQNSSIPRSWKNVNDFVEAVLVRSYSGAWIISNQFMVKSRANTTYIPALPGLVAEVNDSRVYGWLGLQLFVALLGMAFLMLQAWQTKFPLMGGTSLTAFYMDTTGVPRDDLGDPFKNGTLKVVEEGNRLKLRIE